MMLNIYHPIPMMNNNFQPRCLPEDEDEPINGQSECLVDKSSSIIDSNHHQQQQQSSLTMVEQQQQQQCSILELMSNLNNGKLLEQAQSTTQPSSTTHALDLSAQEQLQRAKLTELLLLKNIHQLRNNLQPSSNQLLPPQPPPPSSFYSSSATTTTTTNIPNINSEDDDIMDEDDGKNLGHGSIENGGNNNNKDNCSMMDEPLDESVNESSPIEQLLQMYGFNREHYLKILQHQQQMQQQAKIAVNQDDDGVVGLSSNVGTIESMDLSGMTPCGPGPAPWVDKSTLHSLGIQGELINKSMPIDYTHYVKRYGNSTECGNSLCKELNYREHFHCNALSCNSRVFMKKEEMIRHFKWHKKRDESLTHGFLRCSPADNCVERFRTCPHHRKQTHYHCLKRGCDKVYISTSDVQMHANYHRKDTAIIQEGFQRFRATENCLLETCAFFGQKTTHFHCRRDNCSHTFKNKADMEKHKSYHIRDEQLARDGFKKFMKHETCTFDDCRSSRVCNHIHCIRPGCSHVLHSTGQLYPHKRKHERRENELSYRKYRLAQTIHRVGNNCGNIVPPLDSFHDSFDHSNDDDTTLDTLAAQLPLAQISTIPIEDILGEIGEKRFIKYIQRHPFGSRQCHFELSTKSIEEHYCCTDCKLCWLDQSNAIDHAKKHVIQEEATLLLLEETNDTNICNNECTFGMATNGRHYHCRMFGCPFTVSIQDKTLTRLEHYKFHEEQYCQFIQSADCVHRNSAVNTHQPTNEPLTIQQLLSLKPNQLTNQTLVGGQHSKTTMNEITKRSSPTLQVFPTGTTLTSVDGLPVLKRKRGRPPKNRSNDILNLNSRITSSPSSSSSLTNANNSSITKNSNNNNNNNHHQQQQQSTFAPMLGPMSSFDLATAFNLPLKHANVISNISPKSNEDTSKTIPIPLIMPYLRSSIHNGFYVFDDETPCPDMACVFFGQKHFHCSKPRCYYVTNRDEVLLLHTRDFHDNIDIMEGFVYFDENIDCKLATCPSNKVHKHFHCTRVGCNFTFVHYSLMSPHEDKHRDNDEQSHLNNENHFGEQQRRKYSTSTDNDAESVLMSTNMDSGVGGSIGSMFGLNSTQDRYIGRSRKSCDTTEDHGMGENFDQNSLKNNLSMLHSLQNLFHGQARLNALNAFTSNSGNSTLPSSSLNENLNQESAKHYLYSETNPCNSPFCKLKRRNHFHCNICNQAFSTFERLLPHSTKHVGAMIPIPVYQRMIDHQGVEEREHEQDVDGVEEQQQHHHHHQQQQQQQQLLLNNLQNQFTQNSNFANHFLQILMNNWMNLPSTSTASNVNTPTATLPFQVAHSTTTSTTESSITKNNNDQSTNGSIKRRSSFSSDGSYNEYHHKKSKMDNDDSSNNGDQMSSTTQSNTTINRMMATTEDSSSPNGSYLRFRFNEDCGFHTCVYREHQTHFHCMRKDCGYSFCDKTRFVQHTARHERLDSLMGGDFQQFRSSVSCMQSECPFGSTVGGNLINNNCGGGVGGGNNMKTSHFHCLKCDYVCADTNKVVAHRRQHAKMDNISAAGFEKYSPSQDCQKEMCNYRLKQTHYHCLTCNYSVLGLSQMSSHKFKHQQQQQLQSQD
ncbi:Zinc finger protein castor 1 [Blomia tropicalis]|nr:Zinc finger protein castor 1 [Blomia tropicalis]